VKMKGALPHVSRNIRGRVNVNVEELSRRYELRRCEVHSSCNLIPPAATDTVIARVEDPVWRLPDDIGCDVRRLLSSGGPADTVGH
jgi:hypothetical protein